MTQPWIEGRFEENVVTTTVEQAINWARQSSIWPMTFGLACCAIEMMGTGAAHNDLARFGMEAMRFSPRQSDVMIVAGRVPMKMMPVLQRVWLQMHEPKWCISMGACASTGGVFDTILTEGNDVLSENVSKAFLEAYGHYFFVMTQETFHRFV